MRVLLDLSVLLDVIRKDSATHPASSAVMSKVMVKELSGVLPAHCLHYIFKTVSENSSMQQAYDMVDWFLVHFEIASQDKNLFMDARTLDMVDFEHAVVASIARFAECDHLITWDLDGYKNSPIEALTPAQLLEKFGIRLD